MFAGETRGWICPMPRLPKPPARSRVYIFDHVQLGLFQVGGMKPTQVELTPGQSGVLSDSRTLCKRRVVRVFAHQGNLDLGFSCRISLTAFPNRQSGLVGIVGRGVPERGRDLFLFQQYGTSTERRVTMGTRGFVTSQNCAIFSRCIVNSNRSAPRSYPGRYDGTQFTHRVLVGLVLSSCVARCRDQVRM